jgi:hypothetical protein
MKDFPDNERKKKITMLIESNKSSINDDVTYMIQRLSIVSSMAFNSIQIVVYVTFGVSMREMGIRRTDSLWMRERKTIRLPIKLI